VEFDEAANRTGRKAGEISKQDSAVKVLIIPADEEIIVARETVNVVESARVSQST